MARMSKMHLLQGGPGAPSLNFRPLNYVGPLQGGTDESSKENMGEGLADMNECEGVYIPTRERLLI